MRERGVREQIAGNKTGPTGTNSVDLFGYINGLKDCDAAVQWALFMPDMVERQQKGFKVDRFEYIEMSAMRFVGKECIEHDASDMSWELTIMRALDSMPEYKSDFSHDVLLMHHYGLGVDIGPWHGFWGTVYEGGCPGSGRLSLF